MVIVAAQTELRRKTPDETESAHVTERPSHLAGRVQILSYKSSIAIWSDDEHEVI